ncbi:D-isomer specific 2-hydroxyacid dehydrogenase family protein [Citrus sinensis]|uniref:D-isomer specific 2-hydroxyacid dehydrogenase family protein n=1 Tax=Citrus sinensis TaxID=2711 RepID=A0ACB8M651_CITSI|nr:D-isomer specific 2-hydroxyacid dehydrogenase family protein [Citrus sinensis]
MAFKPKSIWRLAKIVNFHLGLPNLVPNGCGFASDLRFFTKWECCSAAGAGVLAQTHDSQSTGFQENLNLLSNISKMEGMARSSDKNITRVLFCGPHFPASHNYTKEYLQNYPSIQVDVIPISDAPDVIANYHLCVVKTMRLDSNVISRANQMKLIMQFGVGLEGVDINAATRCGIKVARIPGDVTGNAASCAELTIYLMLGLLRKQNEMRMAIEQKKLGVPTGETLLGKTVFILGFGNIGVELAKRLRPFGVKIIATKRSWASHSQVSCQSSALAVKNGIIDDLVDEKGCHEDIFKFASMADVVVCCLSLNKQTAGIVNKSFLSSMKKGSLLVNIARGGLLDYEAIAHYLESGHLGGLGIDVAWTEPFDPNDPILKFKNVLITPHVGVKNKDGQWAGRHAVRYGHDMCPIAQYGISTFRYGTARHARGLGQA